MTTTTGTVSALETKINLSVWGREDRRDGTPSDMGRILCSRSRSLCMHPGMDIVIT